VTVRVEQFADDRCGAGGSHGVLSFDPHLTYRTKKEHLGPAPTYPPNFIEAVMYDAERLKAVEELTVALLRANPRALTEIEEAAATAVPFLDVEESAQGAEARRFWETVQVAKRQLIRRAKYGEAGPIAAAKATPESA
jgi:hypothetical protein